MTPETALGRWTGIVHPADPARAEPLPVAHADTSAAAFTAFYNEHFRSVSGYAQSLTGDPAAAADVAQEAFTRLFMRWNRVRDPRTWVFFVATNLTRDHWRRAARERRLTDALGPAASADVPAYDPWLSDLVQRLPERLRQPVLLHYYADLPIEDVARLMRRPVGTIKQRLHQARQQLALATQDAM